MLSGTVLGLRFFRGDSDFLRRDCDHGPCVFSTDLRYVGRDTFHDLPVVVFENVEQWFSTKPILKSDTARGFRI
jgi:hypothetical protein